MKKYYHITKYTVGDTLEEQIDKIEIDGETRLIFSDGNVVTSKDLKTILKCGFDLELDIDIDKAVWKPKPWKLRK